MSRPLSARPVWSALARVWDHLLGQPAGFTSPPPPPASLPARLTLLPLEERVVPDGRPHPDPLVFVGTGSGAPPRVRAYHADTGELAFERQPFESEFAGGVRVAAGDINLDGYPDLIAAAGPGGGPRVVVLDGKTGDPIDGPLSSFYAYDPSFAGGVWVASGDADGDGVPDVITAAGSGGGPHVKVFSGKTGAEVASFYAYDPDFAGGVSIAAVDLTGDGRVELITGAGPGGGPHVKVWDLSSGSPVAVRSFYAYDPSFAGGVEVGTDFVSGDVTGDGRADIVTGAGPGGGPHVKVFDGASGAEVRNFYAFDPSFTGGVRVGTAFVNDDKYADLIVGAGDGGGQVKVFSGATSMELAAPMSPYTPFGDEFTGGLYVAGSNDPVVTSVYTNSQFGPAVVNQTIAFMATVVKQSGSPTPTGTVTFSNGGKTLGTAPLFADPATGNAVGGIVIPASQYNGTSGGAGVSIGYSGDSVYANYGYFTGAYVTLNPGSEEGCGCGAESDAGAGGTPDAGFKTDGGVGLDGSVVVTRNALSGQAGSAADKFSDATGTFGQSSGSTATLSAAGSSDEIALALENPSGTSDPNGTSIALVEGGHKRWFFDKYYTYDSFPFPAPTFHPRNYNPYSLTLDATNAQIVVSDGAGTTFTFWDFSSGNGGKAGRLQKKTLRDGSYYQVVSWDGSGKPTETQTVVGSGSTAVTESITYATSGGVATATLRRKVGSGSWSTVHTADTSDANGTGYTGSKGQLQTVKDASGNALETTYLRYEGTVMSSSGRVKYFFGPAAYARLVAALGTGVAALTDTQIAPYADQYYAYDSNGRATTAVVAGEGCSACSGGQGTYTYTYTDRSPDPTRYADVWVRKVTETLPDSSTNTYYLDAGNRLLFKAHSDGTNTWGWAYQYDISGRLVAQAEPSAVSGSSESLDDLVGWGGGTTYLRSGDGLISTTTYGSGTTATSSTAGDVLGYVKSTAIQRGTGGTPVPQSATTYIARTAGGQTYYFPATSTQYRNDNGTGAETITSSYTWAGSTAQMASVTTTLPIVTTAQNGPNTAASTTTVFDAIGRPIWSKNAAGVLGYTAYDDATGAVVKTIADVNTANTSDFTDLPSGWSTPSGAGQHLVSTFEVDTLGRTTKSTDPLGLITYTVYDDANHAIRMYAGWNSSTNTPTGPTVVSRDDLTNGYSETLTMSATPTVSGGRPTGAESVSGIQSLSRSYVNAAGQAVSSDSYFDLTGVTYSTAANLGTQNTNYYRTETGYGKQAGQVNREVSAAGTITRTEYDTLGRAVSTWVGTDDTPTTGYWSVTNLTGTNMVKVSETEYDGGGVWDSNVTKWTVYPGGGAAARVTQTWYDWRDRAVGVKSGVESSESTSVNRPLSYTEYDNLGTAVVSESYDGDTVSLTDGNSDGIPDRPSSSLLRAKTVTSTDERGQAYKSETYSVDPSSGNVSSYALTSQTWYDLRGLTLKTSTPGGLVRKTSYDSLGRAITTFITDGGGDWGWSDVGNVTGDMVLSQVETAYDADGNVLQMVDRERMHNSSGTGVLGDVSSGINARVSYSANYFDLANRLTDSVDVGTNGGTAWTRPGSVPSRSDTVLVQSTAYDAAGRVWKATDPRGIESRATYDLLGRTTKTVENYVDGVVSDADDRTTEYAYGPAGRTSLTAKLTGGGGQTTQWVYGVTQSGSSGLDSNDLVGATKWPDPSTGAASSGQQETVLVNALGQPLVTTDRNGNVHTLSYDVLGRVTADTVTTLGSGVDGSVRRIETAYDTQGNAYLFTSYDAVSGGSIVTQTQRAFNGLGQLITEWQSRGAAVNTSTSPKVQYAYSTLDSSNKSRLTSVTYPSGYVLTYNYSSGINSDVSRLSSLSDTSGTLESYDYLGLGTVVQRAHPQSGVDQTYILQIPESIGDAGDQYNGLDRFGRVVIQRSRTSSADVDRNQYAFDRDGNRVTKTNSMNSAYSEAFTFDGLNQLSTFNRNSGARTQSWDYDAVGNWDGVTTNGSTQTRTANKQNEITVVSGATTPTYDSNGNMTTDETGLQYVYDAWNHLKIVKNSGGTTLKTYTYDALSRRVAETASGTTTDLYYSAQLQVLEEAVSGTTKTRYVWSPVYVDAMVLRDRDADTNSGNGLEERLWVMQDANWNVTGLVNNSGTVVERYAYDPFGAVSIMNGSWTILSGSGYGWQYLFQGARRDSVTGLDDHDERWYSPTLGRWITMDPIRFDSGCDNLYMFVNNRPADLVDPFGLQAAPKLSINPVAKPKTGKYGSVIWGVNFQLDKPSDADCGGWIVQYINMSDTNKNRLIDPNTKDPDEKNSKGSYFEAWYVPPGKKEPLGKSTLSPAPYFGNFMPDPFRSMMFAVSIYSWVDGVGITFEEANKRFLSAGLEGGLFGYAHIANDWFFSVGDEDLAKAGITKGGRTWNATAVFIDKMPKKDMPWKPKTVKLAIELNSAWYSPAVYNTYAGWKTNPKYSVSNTVEHYLQLDWSKDGEYKSMIYWNKIQPSYPDEIKK